jgi:Fe-S-cluster containining protein
VNQSHQAQVLEELTKLHRAIDRRARAIAGHHAGRLNCAPGCAACCRDDLTVFSVEAELIRREQRGVLAHETPHPPGQCPFLSAALTCRIYEQRPYVCRTQGLPLRWIAENDAVPTTEDETRSAVEYRDICPLNAPGPPLEALPPAQCWTLGPWEERLRRLQLRWDDNRLSRVRLRDLFDAR